MIITIARQCGCGALHIGEQLAARYDIPFYTRKSLLEMARAKGVLAEMDDFFEERPVDELQFAISALGHDEGPLHSRALDILSDMIGQSECIIVGRKGREADRIRAVAAEEGVTPRKAAAIVHDMDDSRVRYHMYYTHLQWGNSADYDLCFDSVRLGTEKSVALIGQYIEGLGIRRKEA